MDVRALFFVVVSALMASAACGGSGDDHADAAGTPDATSNDAEAADGLSERADDIVTGDMSWTKDGASSDAPLDVSSEFAADSPQSGCSIQQTVAAPAGAARSASYTGTDTAYFGLYGGPCQIAADCVSPCVAAGGTMASCASGSACLAGEGVDGGLGCQPPTYWLSTSGALSESDTTTNAAGLILVNNPYDDALVLTGFGVAIPDGATITGIQFNVRRATLARNAVDGMVQILRNGAPVGDNHALTDAWPSSLTYATYGGAQDAWGVTWTPADVHASGFGISLVATYTGPSAGNERAYVDSVRLIVFYTAAGCD